MSDKNTKKPEEATKAETTKPEKETKAKAAPATDEVIASSVDEEEGKRVDPKDLKDARKEKKVKAQEKAGAIPAAKGAKAPSKGKGKGEGKGGGKEKAAGAFVKRVQPPRLKTKYYSEIVSALTKEFGYKTPMAVPRLLKITLNMGLGQALQNPKLIEAAEAEMRAITGQKPVITKARKSIATYKLRQGQKIGCMVTLRRERMFEFLDRFVSFALPRTRDFKGISSKSFDGRGNYSIGIREQIVFPEIEYDKIEKIMGMNITIVTSAKTDEEGRALLRHLGMPFR